MDAHTRTDPIWGGLASLMYARPDLSREWAEPRDRAMEEVSMEAATTEAPFNVRGSGIPDDASVTGQDEGTASAAVDAQDGLFDQVVEDADLEAALEAREKQRQDRAVINARYKEAHDKVSGKLEALELDEESVVRCGRFRIKTSRVPSRSVAFETSPSKRTTISLIGD